MADTFRYKRIRLQSVSESSSEKSDTESVNSFQGKETDYARDTSDTSDNFEVEVPDFQSCRNVLLSSTDDSDLEDIAELGAVVAALAYEENIDLAILADGSEENPTSPTSNSDADPELPRSDYLDFHHCLICKTEEKDISYPYCPKCFLWKKSFFPPRPEKKRKKSTGEDVKDSKDSKQKSADESLSDIERLQGSTSSGSKFSSQESSYEEGPFISSHENMLCKTCCVRKMNGVFIHGSSGHMHSCYTCAKKTWKNIGVCPLCRKKCQNVIKLYTTFNDK